MLCMTMPVPVPVPAVRMMLLPVVAVMMNKIRFATSASKT
jgi:hypothetical protein